MYWNASAFVHFNISKWPALQKKKFEMLEFFNQTIT